MRLSNFHVPVAIAGLALLASTTAPITTSPVNARPLEGTRNSRPVSSPMTAEEFDRRYDWKSHQQFLELEQARQRSRRCLNTSAHLFPTLGHAARYAAKVGGCVMWQNTGARVPPGTGGCDPEQARAMGFKPERGDCNGGYWSSPRW